MKYYHVHFLVSSWRYLGLATEVTFPRPSQDVSLSLGTSTIYGTGRLVSSWQVCSRSETWINLAPLKLLWDLDPSTVDLAGDIGAPFGHGPVLGPANVRTYSSPEVDLLCLFMVEFAWVCRWCLVQFKRTREATWLDSNMLGRCINSTCRFYLTFYCDFRQHWTIIVMVRSSQRNPPQ